MDAKLDAKRLEELAEFAKEMCRLAPTSRDVADLLALARCAKAWAKIERMLMKSPIIEIRNTGKKRVVESLTRLRVYEDTVVEAVEAAPEVTDAK